MTKINVVSDHPTIGLQVFDRYFAYRQSQNQKNNYKSDVEIGFSDQVAANCVNVLVAYMPETEINYDEFDFVFLDNAGEPFEVATPIIKQLLDKDSKNKFYFLTGSFVDDDFVYAEKIIPYNVNLNQFHRYHTDGFYPLYYDKKSFDNLHRAGVCFINGQNRSWRNYIMTLIDSRLPNVDIYSNISENVVETLTPDIADSYDKIFCKFLKKNVAIIDEISREEYAYRSIKIGVNEKFGSIPVGYFFIENYFK